MTRKKITAADLLVVKDTEHKDYLYEEIRRRTLASTLNLITGENLDRLVVDFSHKFALSMADAKQYVNMVLKDHARCLPVTEILTNQIIETSAMLKNLKEDLDQYNTDYEATKDATEQGIYGTLKQKAYKNLTDVLKCQIELLSKMGGLQLAKDRLVLEKEKFELAKDNKFDPDVSDKVNYDDLSEDEINKRLKDRLTTKKHVYQSEQILDPKLLIDFDKE